jgi:Flp pilus assembly protein TadB
VAVSRVALALAAVLAAAALAPAGIAASQTPLQVQLVAGAAFPERELALVLPAGSRLTASDVRVSENGAAASGLALAPVAAPAGSTRYLLRYESHAGPAERIDVVVSVRGAGSASLDYETPGLSIPAAPPYRPSLADRVWGSGLTMLVLALLGGLGVALIAVGLSLPRRGGVPERMAEFVSVPGLQAWSSQHPGRDEPADAESAVGSGRQARLDEALAIAGIRMRGGALVGSTLAATVAVVAFAVFAGGSPWWGILGLLTPLLVREWVARKLDRRRKQFSEQLPDALQVIASALRSGHSFAGALAVVVDSAGEPMKSEMQQVVAAERRGTPLDEAVAVVVRRMQNRDLEQVGLVATLQREAGTSSAEVVDRVAETIRERFELRRLVRTLTVQGRMSRWIVSALPVGLVIFLELVSPDYLHPLTSSLGGRVVLVLAGLMVVGGSYVIKRIVDIKV